MPFSADRMTAAQRLLPKTFRVALAMPRHPPNWPWIYRVASTSSGIPETRIQLSISRGRAMAALRL